MILPILSFDFTDLIDLSVMVEDEKALAAFLAGKSAHALMLFDHFIAEFNKVAPVTVHPAKTMIGIANPHKRVAWVTQFGKSFLHVVFPFKRPYADNLCFKKIANVPGDDQYNHHFRMLHKEDVNDEVISFMRQAYADEML